jgi:3-phosphoshikimate 1-carboxyvinyltransferase
MKRYVYPSEISGTVKAPASKSEMQRGAAAALLAQGESILVNPSFCDDALAALDIIEKMGAKVKKTSDNVIIQGGLDIQNGNLNCGESGLGIRMFTPLAALAERPVTLTAEGTLLKRPVSLIENELAHLGAEVTSNKGYAPIKITSALRGGETEIDGSISSQSLTGLLMALPAAANDSIIKVNNLTSRRYIDMTIKILKAFSIDVENIAYKEFRIKGKQKYKPAVLEIEGDWSGAAFLLCAGAINGSLKVTGLNTASLQPDMAVLEALKAAEADLIINSDSVEVKKSSLKGFTFDASQCPDLFPPLAALALFCEGTTEIKGVHRLKHKETDRSVTIKEELAAIGGDITIEGDSMIIKKSPITGGDSNSRGDHRIAMACAIAALKASGPVSIEDAEAVNKSYPQFFDDIMKAGVKIR